MSPSPIDWCPYKERTEHREAPKNGPVKEGAEIGVKLPQAKECLQLPDLEEARMDSFLETSEVGWSYQYLDFGLSASPAVRRKFLFLLSYMVVVFCNSKPNGLRQYSFTKKPKNQKKHKCI